MECSLTTSTSSTHILSVLLFLSLFFNCLFHFGSAQLLLEEEVQTLKTIAEKLRINVWPSINGSSCNGAGDLKNISSANLAGVYCDCSFVNDTVCHVVFFVMKDSNLTGVLPEEFADLTYLQTIDLTRNYVGGSLPKTLGKMSNFTKLSLIGNRINGSIPEEISEIATLTVLELENNQLQGSLPPSIGNLSSLQTLTLSANNFSGTIPKEFEKLTNLSDFRIDGNGIFGPIPGFIGNWKNLTRLDMQGTSMEGPFPPTISQLTNLVQLRVSDLKGPEMKFPDLANMKNMRTLILRNCSINGSIPNYIEDLPKLKLIDLSFNQLTGKIPDNIGSLEELEYLFLANNSLSQSAPEWMVNLEGSRGKNLKNVDASYNNFTTPPSGSYCISSPVNLVSSYSSSEDGRTLWCLKKDLPCPQKPKYHKLFINCGGEEIPFKGEIYEADQAQMAASQFIAFQNQKWACSSSGMFVGTDTASKLASTSSMTDVYNTARLAPTSLKYYGLCLRKGSYKVRLHFAEIVISNNLTTNGIGRRIFDVSVQGNVVLQDFNIAEKANGTEKVYIETIKEVNVSGSTMEIHLYWAGKGTNAIPTRGVYGPLISAISITPNYDPDPGLSIGAIIGIVAASCVVLVLILIVLRMKGCLGGKDKEDKELRALELQTGYFTLRQIKASTNNFSLENKIGEGGFGPVYKGVLSYGAIIAVKQLSAKSKQGNREFVNEIGMISALQHPNLVRLFGCCIEGNQLLLIYEYMENNSLARALFGPVETQLNLDWPTRKKICLGIARGLAYLHEESRLKIVHRDIKATNVLLDKDLNAKISDFGLAKLHEDEDEDKDENTHISTRIAGTIGYMAPEYATRGYLTDKADVYSFGVVTLEIVCGKSNTNYRPKQEFVYLLNWAYVLAELGNLSELVDPILGSNYSEVEALEILNLVLLCTNPSPTLRPTMSSVVSMLDGKIPVQAPVVKPTSLNEDWRFKAFGKKISEDSQSQVLTFSCDSQVQGRSMDGPWIDSSSKDSAPDLSASSKLLADLYDVNLS